VSKKVILIQFHNSLGNCRITGDNAQLPRELCNWLGKIYFAFCKDSLEIAQLP
jgi:hypothetical protein